MSAVVHTGSSEARSAWGTKLIVVSPSARTTPGAANAAAPASPDFKKSRRFIADAPRSDDGRFPTPGLVLTGNRRSMGVFCKPGRLKERGALPQVRGKV